MNIIKSYRYSSTRYVYFPWTAWLPFWYQNWTHNVSLDTSPSTSSLESVSWSFTQPRLMGFTGILPFRNVFFHCRTPEALKIRRFFRAPYACSITWKFILKFGTTRSPQNRNGDVLLNIQQGYTHCESPVVRAELPIPWSQSVGIVDNFRP